MGSAPFIRPGANEHLDLRSIGKWRQFRIRSRRGPANYIARGFALNQLKDVFITHLHVDHFGGLPYVWMFGIWAGGWADSATVPCSFIIALFFWFN